MNDSEIQELVEGAIRKEKYSIAKLISLIEREDSLESRKTLFSRLQKKGKEGKKSLTIGLTGTPGAGKSSLLGELSRVFLETLPPPSSMAIVAIDPTSALSGGSILGDRTRVLLPRRENRIYFRSQASQLELGGLNPSTYHVVRLLRSIFDIVFVETVGIGQNEIEVSMLCDYSFLVLQPLGGDQIQFMKSGIMEVPSAFILNKCDEEELANSSYHTLVATLEFIKDILKSQSTPPVYRTSVTKKKGIEALLHAILELPRKESRNNEAFVQIQKWIRSEYGRYGLKKMPQELAGLSNYEEMEECYSSRILRS